jgi:MinD-like ATPase involved in chromosome partitioning or flagellar assembly
MTVLAVCSVKHSPGATTLALALTSACSNTEASDDVPVVLVEADPTGGDLGARLGLSLDPGLVALAASARHAGSGLDVLANAQPLPCGGVAVLGPVNPQQAEAALSTVGPRLCESLRELGGGVIDCGRWAVGSRAADVMRAADLTLVVTRPDVAGVEHLRERLESLRAVVGQRLAIALLGERPYGVDSIRDATGVPLVVTFAVDRDGVEAISGGSTARSARRSRLVRSARSILDSIASNDLEAALA